MDQNRSRSKTGVCIEDPLWAWLLAGGLFASLGPATGLPDARAGLFPSAAPRETLELLSASPQELRRLPGIGPARAAAIAKARWDQGTENFDLTAVPGIGERTEARVMEWLEAQGAGP